MRGEVTDEQDDVLSSRRRFISASGLTLAGTAVGTVALFGETLILGRWLTPTEFGLLVLVLAFPDAVLQVLDFRVGEATNKFLSAYLATGRRAEAVALLKLLWSIDVCVGIVALAIVFVAAPLAAEILVPDSSYTSLFVIYAAALFLGSFDSAAGTILRVFGRFGLAFAAGTGTAVLRVGSVLVAVLLDGGVREIVWARAFAEIAATVLKGVLTLVALRSLWPERRAPISLLRPQARELRGFMVSTNLIGLTRMASSKFDVMIIGALASPSAVSLYKVGTQLARTPQVFADALTITVFPSFARNVATGHLRATRRALRKLSLVLAATLAPLWVLAAMFGADLTRFVFGPDYAGAGAPFAIALAGVIPAVVLFWAYPLVLAAGLARPALLVYSFTSMLQLLLLVPLVLAAGATGAAIALAVGQSCGTFLILNLVRRRRLLASAT